MRAKDVGAGGWRHAHSSRSRWADGRKSRAPVGVPLAAMKDSARKSGARVDIAGGWFLHWLLHWFLVWFLNWFLDWGWGRGQRGLGQGWLLPEEERAYQQHGCQQQSPVRNASVHNQLSRRWNAALDYSRRSFCMIGNLRITFGRNSSTRLPPASVAIDVTKVSPTTLPVTLGSG